MKHLSLLILLFFSLTTSHAQKLQTGCYYLSDTSAFMRVDLKQGVKFFINPAPILTTKDFKKIKLSKNKYTHEGELRLELTEKGKNIFADVTEKNIGKKLAFIIDNELVFVPVVQAKIAGGKVSISGLRKNKVELKKIKKVIEAEMKK